MGELIARVRWGNVARLAAVVAAGLLVVAGPHGCSKADGGPPPLPPDERIATPPPAPVPAGTKPRNRLRRPKPKKTHRHRRAKRARAISPAPTPPTAHRALPTAPPPPVAAPPTRPQRAPAPEFL
jgi:hypothetical protein